ncbi:MAG: hypothetical protein AABX05_02455 [Nanoarchaeota archaeon]
MKSIYPLMLSAAATLSGCVKNNVPNFAIGVYQGRIGGADASYEIGLYDKCSLKLKISEDKKIRISDDLCDDKVDSVTIESPYYKFYHRQELEKIIKVGYFDSLLLRARTNLVDEANRIKSEAEKEFDELVKEIGF